MSNLKRCDRCGVSVPLLTVRYGAPEGWICLGVYNGLGESLDIFWDVCPSCKDAAFEFFKPSAETV